jgi:hypothetical protein
MVEIIENFCLMSITPLLSFEAGLAPEQRAILVNEVG